MSAKPLPNRGFALIIALTCNQIACSDEGPTGAGAGGQASLAASGSGGNAEGDSTAGSSPAGTPGTAGTAGTSGGGAAAGQMHGGSGGAGGAGAASGGAAGGASGGRAGAGGSSAAVDLFNGTDLTGFNVYRQNREKAPGTLLPPAEALAVFKPEAGMIHVYADAPDQSPQVHYTLVTTESYRNYRLTWDYKWGTKKFAPYTDVVRYPRDAGVLWHIHGDITQLWPASIEFQNKDGTTGDIFALYARCTAPASADDKKVFAEGGAPVLVDGSNGFVQHGRSANFEVAGDWTSCSMEVKDGTAVYSVNGHIVNRVLTVMDATGKPVSSGPIAWQAEQAEVYYRHLRIEVLP